MRVIVWSDFQKKTNSTKIPTTSGIEMQGYLRNSDPFSMFSPNVCFELADKTAPPLWTYMYIPEFNRYYWITNWTHNQGVWIASTGIDVLATYKEEIGNTDMYVLRASNMCDPYVVDTKYPMTADLLEYTDNASSVWVQTPGTTVAILDPEFWNKYLPEGCFILSVYGPNNSGITSYALNYQGFKNFAQKLYDFNITAEGFWDQIPASYAKAVADPVQFVSSVRWYPTLPFTQLGSASIKLGYYDIGTIEGAKLLESDIKPVVYYKTTFNLRKHPQEERGKFLNSAPYSNYKLRLPPFGEFDLDSSRLIDCSRIDAEWYADYHAGKAKLYLWGIKDTYRFFLGDVEAQFGVDVPLNQNTINISEAATKSALIWGAVGAYNAVKNMEKVEKEITIYDSGPMDTYAGTSEPTTVTVSVPTDQGDAISTAVGGFMAFNPALNPKLSTVGGIASFIDYMSGVPGAIIATFYTIVGEDRDNIGRPVCVVKKPKDLGGYLIVENPKIRIIGTVTETLTIKNILTGGFYYE